MKLTNGKVMQNSWGFIVITASQIPAGSDENVKTTANPNSVSCSSSAQAYFSRF